MSVLSQPVKPDSQRPLEPERPTAHVERGEVRIKGKALVVPSIEIDGMTVVTTGKWLKIAVVRDEELLENDTVMNPESFFSQLKKSGLKADLFTFGQRVPDDTPKYSYYKEWENAATLPITTFSDWLKERAEYSIRKGVNRAKKLGVMTQIVEFDDTLLDAICRIYDETPVRQGKNFWHYGRDKTSIKRALATYLDRSIFIGAYYQDELIGFMKMTWVGATGTITQILSMKRHFDKKPNNSLIAKAIEICEVEKKTHFIYGSFVYYDENSSLTEFKRRIGFESIALPRYYVPLTFIGKVAVKVGLHRGIAANLPKPMLHELLKVRKLWSEYKLKNWKHKEEQAGKGLNEPV